MNAYDELASYRFASGRDYDKRSVETFRARGLNLVDDLLNQITVLRDEVETLRALVPELPPAAPTPKHAFADSWLTALATEAEFPPPSAPALADRPRFDMEQRSDQQRESARPGELSGWLTGLESTPAVAEVAPPSPASDTETAAPWVTAADDLWPTANELPPAFDTTTDGDAERDQCVATFIEFVDESPPVDPAEIPSFSAPDVPEAETIGAETRPSASDSRIAHQVAGLDHEPEADRLGDVGERVGGAGREVGVSTVGDAAEVVVEPIALADLFVPEAHAEPTASIESSESTEASASFEVVSFEAVAPETVTAETATAEAVAPDTVTAEAVTDEPEARSVTDVPVPEPVPVPALPAPLDESPTFHDDLRRLEDLDLARAHAEAAAAEPPSWAVLGTIVPDDASSLAPTTTVKDPFAAAPSADPTPGAPPLPAILTTPPPTTVPSATIPPPRPPSPPPPPPAMVPATSRDALEPMPTALVPVGSAAVGGSGPHSVTAYARGQVDQWPIVIEALPPHAVGLPVPVRHWSGWLKD